MPLNAMAGCVLPEEMMVSILMRLPVKSILRFKSVCKPWLELLSTREFIKMHQGQFSSDPKNHSLILCGRVTYTGTNTTCLLNFDSNENQQPMTTLDYPFPDNYRVSIVGCWNGLICMRILGRSFRESERGFLLWNPATKLFKIVHLSKVDSDRLRVSLGFGYDVEGEGDFKVVRIVGLKNEITEENKNITRVEVYSFDSDSWIIIEPGFRFSALNSTNTFIMNGNPYWYAKLYENESDYGLVWFDVTKLVLNFVPLLQTLLRGTHHGKVYYVDWNGALGAIEYCANNEDVVTAANVWVFDNVERIWRKNQTFGPIEGTIEGSMGWTLPFLKNGELLCLKDGKLFVIDLENGRVKEIVISAPQMDLSRKDYFKVCGYTEGLSRVKGMVKS